MSTFKFYQEHVLSEHPEYRAVLHELRSDAGDQMVTIHIDCDPLRFSPGVLKRIKKDWTAFRSCTDAIIFAIEPEPDSMKWQRFVSPLGFEFSSRVDCTDGQSRRVFVSTKNNKNEHTQHTDHGQHSD